MEKVSEFFMMLGSLEVPSFKHISPANRMWGRSVNCSDAGTWDPVRIAEVFWPTDREAILSIPLSSTGSSQNCRWYSGCLFLLQQAALGEGTSLNIARQWWTVIWKVKGPLPPQKKKRKGSSYLHGESTMMHYRQKGNYLKGLLVKQVAVPFVGRWKLLFMLYLPVLRPNQFGNMLDIGNPSNHMLEKQKHELWWWEYSRKRFSRHTGHNKRHYVDDVKRKELEAAWWMAMRTRGGSEVSSEPVAIFPRSW